MRVQKKDREQRSSTVTWYVTLATQVWGCFENLFYALLLWTVQAAGMGNATLLPVWAMQHYMMWCEVDFAHFTTVENSPAGSKAWRQTKRSQMWKAVWPWANEMKALRLKSILYKWPERKVELSIHNQRFGSHIEFSFRGFRKMICLPLQ